MKDIRAYIFDLDGTLVDSEILWVEATEILLREKGYSVTHSEALGIVYGTSWHDIYDILAERYPKLRLPVEQVAAELERCFVPLRDTRDIRIHGSVNLLRRLSETHPVCIVSGSYAKDIEHAIALMDITAYVSFYVGNEHVHPGKPDPACYRLAAQRLGVPPHTCVVFEDSNVGICAAKAAGMRCVALARPDRPKQDTSPADLVLPDLADYSPELLPEVPA